jgi:pyridoxal phosphate enzyme (YggS family)
VRQFQGTAEFVKARFAEVTARVAEAATRASRAPGDVEILVATKYVDLDTMEVLRQASVPLVGENRAQDLIAKRERYGDAFVWDFIGHLQSRKTKLVLPHVRLIHSVSTLSVVQEIEARSAKSVRVLLEVNIDEEETKSGVSPGGVEAFLEAASPCAKVEFCGLMCMPPLGGDPEAARPFFARTRELAARLSENWRGRYTFARLSMGTSADYHVAVEEGATIVRVGSVLFDDTLEERWA